MCREMAAVIVGLPAHDVPVVPFGEPAEAFAARCRAEESGWYTEQMEFAGEAGGKLTGSVKLRMD